MPDKGDFVRSRQEASQKATYTPMPVSYTHLDVYKRQILVTPLGVKLCRPSEAVLDLISDPQRGAFRKEGGEPVVDASGHRAS